MSTTSIIQRRDLEPLWLRAREIVWHYESALDCVAAVMETKCTAADFCKHPKALVFCSLCVRYHQHASKNAPCKYPCFQLHRNAPKKASILGGSYIYPCPAGFLFWTSPFFAGQRFAGAFISSVIPDVKKQEAQDKLFSLLKGNISRAEIAGHIDEVPVKTSEEIQMLAQMMKLCAERVSYRGSGLYEENQDSLCCNGNCRLNGFDECLRKKRKESNILPLQASFGMVDLLDKERLLLANLRRGDNAEAHKITRDILSDLDTSSGGNFEQLKLKAIELVVLLSRSGVNILDNQEPAEENTRFIPRIMESKTVRELSDNLRLAVEQMTGKIFSFRGIRHAYALRKAERFIWENYTRKISLKEVAEVSGLSVPYFSTIFKDEMGENFSSYLNRLRVEKASAMLRRTEYPIHGISAACGFEDQSWFSKIFKLYTGMNPCKYRELGDEAIFRIQDSQNEEVYLN